MLTDAHCHPFDLIRVFPQAEQDRRRLGILAAASACNLEEFTHNEELAQKAAAEKATPLLPCFAIHPQQPAVSGERESKLEERLLLLDDLASQGRIAAIGECGFDLFDDDFRGTEAAQDRIFAAHIETALRYDLPLVIHVRRAMHKIFALSKNLAKCRAVVFHSWPSPFEEGQALLRRGVNAYFSFGNVILNGHKQSVRSLSLFPADRLLTETDAPFQPAQGENFSQWTDLKRIIETASSLRGTDAKEMECQIEANFKAVFS